MMIKFRLNYIRKKIKIKEYLVFIGDVYYPNLGIEDFKKDFDSLDEAKEFANKNIQRNMWYQIAKYSTFEIVYESLSR